MLNTIEDKNIPIRGLTGFNQVVIKLQLILDISFCDYEEEKKKKKNKNIRNRFFYRVDALLRASRGIISLNINSEVSIFFALFYMLNGTASHITEEDANPLFVY